MYASVIGHLKRLWRVESGLAAVEFAMIAPFMITLFLGSVEFTDAFIANRRVTLMASAAADLISQAKQIDDDEMQDIFAATSSILAPYDAANVKIVVSSVIDDDGTNKVDWSDALHGSALNPGSVVEVPEGMITAFGSIIQSDVEYTYTSGLSFMIGDDIVLKKRFYARPRRSLVVKRVD